jgi:hypothetical protein
LANFDLNVWVNVLPYGPTTFRGGMRTVTVNGYIYLTGALNAEVWRSVDGVTWDLIALNPGWTRRCYHGFVYFNNKFWIFGGRRGETDSTIWFDDVWSSDDAIIWTLVAEHAGWDHNGGPSGFTGRSNFGFCIHNGCIYMHGGTDPYLSRWADTYRSDDGISWVLLNNYNNAWLRTDPAMCSFGGYLYLYGGQGDFGAVTNTILRSVNGATWSSLGNASWQARTNAKFLISDDDSQVAIIGGYGIGTYNDVWVSSDGVNFSLINQISQYPGIWKFAVAGLGVGTYIVGLRSDNTAGTVWACETVFRADFLADNTTVHVGDVVTFQNISEGDYFFAMWNFNDGVLAVMTGFEESATHRFSHDGQFTVRLQITTLDGEIASEEKVAYITVLPYQLSLLGTPREGRSPLRVLFNAELVE